MTLHAKCQCPIYNSTLSINDKIASYNLDRNKINLISNKHSDITTYSHRLSFATFVYSSYFRLVALKRAFLSY